MSERKRLGKRSQKGEKRRKLQQDDEVPAARQENLRQEQLFQASLDDFDLVSTLFMTVLIFNFVQEVRLPFLPPFERFKSS